MAKSVHTEYILSMDGVFMRKFMKSILLCQLLLCLVMVGMLIADKQTLSNNVVRLHVVANSDSEYDQSVKLQVRDAVINCLQEPLENVASAVDAKNYILDHLSTLEETANSVLHEAGSPDQATVTLCKEEFQTRHYDTFSLPSGVYDSLRVTIGDGEGKNWWCVVFPEFCMQATVKDMRASAVSSGFSSHLSDTLTDSDYKISFFLLDCIGKIENLFYFR